MALVKHVGDLFDAFSVKLTAAPKALTAALEKNETTLSVGIQAHPDNSGNVFVGNEQSQPWVLVPGAAMTINVSKRSLVFVKGTAGDVANVLIVRTTGELSRPTGA